ncbi:MAG TPA: SHOCT domain-containing protein [Stellaceae bacterium]|nr:SHOCT domain-containing protein [Stellaceae bacterium]
MQAPSAGSRDTAIPTGLIWINAAETPFLYRIEMMKTSSSAFGAIAAGVAFAPVLAAAAETPTEPYTWGPQMMWGWGWYGMMFGPLFMILVLAVVVAVIVLLARWLGGPWQGTAMPQPPPGRTPLDILRERFARGEIDKEEFEERRRVLGE